MTKALVTGPFIGELGYEVGIWTPHLSRVIKESKPDDVICFVRKGREDLYPFATHVGAFSFPYNKSPDKNWMYYPTSEEVHAHTILVGKMLKFVQGLVEEGKKVSTIISDKQLWEEEFKGQRDALLLSGNKPKLDEWKEKLSPGRKAVLVCRAYRRGEKKNTNHTLLREVAVLVKNRGYEPIIVGKSDNGIFAPTNILGINLFNQTTINDVIAIYNLSELVIGASTGTIHLAAACGVPHITWGGKVKEIEERYLVGWNLNKTPVEFIDRGWDILPRQVAEGIDRMVQRGVFSQ